MNKYFAWMSAIQIYTVSPICRRTAIERQETRKWLAHCMTISWAAMCYFINSIYRWLFISSWSLTLCWIDSWERDVANIYLSRQKKQTNKQTNKHTTKKKVYSNKLTERDFGMWPICAQCTLLLNPMALLRGIHVNIHLKTPRTWLSNS